MAKASGPWKKKTVSGNAQEEDTGRKSYYTVVVGVLVVVVAVVVEVVGVYVY